MNKKEQNLIIDETNASLMAAIILNLGIRVTGLQRICKSTQIKIREEKISTLINLLIKDYKDLLNLYNTLLESR
jgi:hypothetical protein